MSVSSSNRFIKFRRRWADGNESRIPVQADLGMAQAHNDWVDYPILVSDHIVVMRFYTAGEGQGSGISRRRR